jgi:xanthine dehydrogenase accessory factor
MELYNEAQKLLSSGEELVYAVMTSNTGSTPRKSGTEMLVRKNGSIIGTIGGGKLEANVILTALTVFDTGKMTTMAFDLTGDDVLLSDSICGGVGEVALYLAHKGDEPVYAAASECRRTGKKGHLVLAIDPDTQGENTIRLFFVTEEKTIIHGTSPLMGMENSILDATAHPGMLSDAGESVQLFVKPVQPNGTVYIFGGGHVAMETAKAAKIAEFDTVIIDDRSEYANRDRFPDSICITPVSLTAIPEMQLSDNDYIVIMTRCHIHDKVVLEWSLNTKAGYIGMIGSIRKREMIYEALLDEGFSQQRLDAVYSPIGIKIGSQTPGEIAISIVAELIQARAKGKG